MLECNKDGNEWVKKDDCTETCDSVKCVEGCDQGQCIIKPVICMPSETHCCDYAEHLHPPCDPCGEDDLCVCDSKGVSWTVLQNCQERYNKDCYKTACRDNPQPICTAEETKCSGKSVMECNSTGTAWNEVKKCDGCCDPNINDCSVGAGGDGASCKTDCDCKANFVCMGWEYFGKKVCRQKCSPVVKCPLGQSCQSAYYCDPD